MTTNGFLDTGTYIGRVWRDDVDGPCVMKVRGGHVVDITRVEFPTVRN